jgi:hypothetical protein
VQTYDYHAMLLLLSHSGARRSPNHDKSLQHRRVVDVSVVFVVVHWHDLIEVGLVAVVVMCWCGEDYVPSVPGRGGRVGRMTMMTEHTEQTGTREEGTGETRRTKRR